MGVYIKGMDMPKSCIKCKLCVSYKCVPTGEIRWSDEFDYDSKRFENCPLVPVPPHRRLIDADALMGVIRAHDYPLKAHFNSTDNGMFTIGIQQAVDEAPTIIPAEEGE